MSAPTVKHPLQSRNFRRAVYTIPSLGTSKLSVFQYTFTMSTSRLREMLSSETQRISNLSQYWQEVLDFTDDIPDDIAGRIRAHIGLSKLLVRDKFQQFAGLLRAYESGIPDVGHKMTVSDLEGFWDLVYIQIDDTIKKYHMLQLLKQNDWEDIQPIGCSPGNPKKRLPLASLDNDGNDRLNRVTSSKRSSRAKKDHTEEVQKRLAEAKLKMRKQNSAKGRDGPSTSASSSSRSHSDEESNGFQHF